MADVQLFGFQKRFLREGRALTDQPAEDMLFLLAHGGRGSGKTTGGALRTTDYMLTHPKSLGIITAPTIPMLRDSTLVTLKGALEAVGLQPERDYEYKSDYGALTIRQTGSVALLRSTEHPDRLRGPSLSFFWMDEPRDSPYIAFQNLQFGLRPSGIGVEQRNHPHQGWLTTTPNGRKHWLFRIFYPDRSNLELESPPGAGRYLAYPAKTLENPFGGKRIYDMMLAQEGTMNPFLKQELDGEFVIVEGLVYPTYSSQFEVPVKSWPLKALGDLHIIAGIDFGWRSPACILVYGSDSHNNRYIIDGLYRSRLTDDELIAKAKAFRKAYNIRVFACDPSDPGWIASARRAGLPAIRAYNRKGSRSDYSYGIGACTAVLSRRTLDNKPKLFVNPSLTWFRNEIEEYTEASTSGELNPPEVPKKSADHAMDAWRYAESYLSLHKPENQRLRQLPMRIKGVRREEVAV